MSESSREAHREVREWSRIVGRSSRKFGSGRESLLDVREWLGSTHGCPGEVKRPTRMSGRGQEAHPNVREWSKAFPDVREWSGIVGRPSRKFGSGRETLLEFWE